MMSTGVFSKARLGRMHDVMAGHVARGDVPGIVTLVSRRGEAHVDALGTMAVGGEAPMQRDTIFRIASVTKPIVAVAAMILVEECRLRLDDPVDRWLPELADRTVLKRLDGPLAETVPAHRPISPRDLLTLRMGFGYILDGSDDWPIQRAMQSRGLAVQPQLVTTPPDAWLAALGSLPLLHQPGEAWMYDTALDVLGVLIARVAGQSLEAFMRERIFEPLGMKDTAFSVPPEQIHRLPPCYQKFAPDGSFELFDAAEGGRFSRPTTFESGRGGLVSTVDDLLAFGTMMLNEGRLGRERILARPTVELMTTDQLTPEQCAGGGFFLGGNRGWGLGMSVFIRRDDVASSPGRFGWDGGYGTSWHADPGEELTAVLLTQVLAFPGELYEHFWTSVYQALDD
jgi:CubicO group peptidase (beta-lactamase class C family)